MLAVDEVTIPEHVYGYPDVAFGGYVAGLLASRVADDAHLRVDFRRRVPVGTPLLVTAAESGGYALTDRDGTVLVEARGSAVTIDLPPAPTWERASTHTEAALPTRRPTDCYGCGSYCAPGKGLRLYPSVLDDRIVAAWTPDAELARPDGTLSPENVWAALDCPGGWAGIELLGMPRTGAVTAALTATRFAPIRAGEDYLSYAWPIGAHGRKFTVGVAVTTADGSPCALAEALWIVPRSTSGAGDPN
ncbi:PaaI family thioesterase [Nocardia bovistercoris]|uniref:Thioesterase family protein n=1 Tax=Nocardia bovistercoris TaxID=2785916 RepID=A0A931N221_9NOCA|nr:hypothetical protein [Nocardia bovistercoris]MBH0776287.1 hypothetical protein [Nocardia bovistercoris]